MHTRSHSVSVNTVLNLSSSLFIRHYQGNPGQFDVLRLFICLNSAGNPVTDRERAEKNVFKKWVSLSGHAVSFLQFSIKIDLVFVCFQYATAAGWELDEALDRVFKSNMSKLENGKPVKNAAGKVTKGRNYKPPYLDDIV